MHARRPSLIRFTLASLGIHLLVFALDPRSPIEVGGPSGPPRPSERPSPSALPFAALSPIEVVELREVVPPDPVTPEPPVEPETEAVPAEAADPPDPVPDVDAVEPEPLDLDRLHEALSRSSTTAPSRDAAPSAAPLEPGGGSEDPGDRAPELRRVRAVPYPDDGPALDGPQSVTVRVHVDARGRVDEVEILEPHPSEALNRAARDAARGYQFRPALRDGRPVAAWSRPFVIPFDRD